MSNQLVRPAWQLLPLFENELAKRNQVLRDFKSNEAADWLRLIRWFKFDWSLPEELAVRSRIMHLFQKQSTLPDTIRVSVLIKQLKPEFARSNIHPTSSSSSTSASSFDVAQLQTESDGFSSWITSSHTYLNRRTDNLPSEPIDESSFGSYIKYVDRQPEHTTVLLQQIQEAYSAYLQATNEKSWFSCNLKIAQCTGPSGIGKSTWTEMSFRHIPASFEFHPDFQPELECCLSNNRIYRTSFSDDPMQPFENDRDLIHRSIAARLLWAHIRYEMRSETTMRTYAMFWQYLRDNCITFKLQKVVKYIFESSSSPSELLSMKTHAANSAERRMIVFILDDFKTVDQKYHMGCDCQRDVNYLQEILSIISIVQDEEYGFLFPIITSTKAGRLYEHIGSRPFKELALGPLSTDQVKDIILDLWKRAHACGQQSETGGDSSGTDAADLSSSSSIVEMQIESIHDAASSSELTFKLPDMFDALILLMDGRPDIVRRFLFHLGKVSIQGIPMWKTDSFLQQMRRLQPGSSAAAPAGEIQQWLVSLVAELKDAEENHYFRVRF